MISLGGLYDKLLKEALENVIEFPNDNFVLSIDRSKRFLTFTPQQHQSVTSNIRSLLNVLKQNFKVTKVRSVEDEEDSGILDIDDPKLRGAFVVEVDPREDFESIVDFIKQQAEQE